MSITFEKHEIEWHPNKIQRIWDYYSSNPVYREQYFAYMAGKEVVEEIRKHVNLRNLENIVDFSCGPGDLLVHVLPHVKEGHSVYGTDVSQNSIDIVNDRFKDQPAYKGAEPLEQFSERWDDESFDLLISTEVVEHLDDTDLEKMLKESNRLLKKGGYIVITTPNNENLEASKIMCPDCGCIFHKWQHQRMWTADTLKRTVEAHSFQTKKVQPIAWKVSKFRKFFEFLRPYAKNGLFYIGQKV